ncbi:MAG: MFS transporter [Bdellovibrionaceae bacterium]|nr:MFS transporter [Pseudobdellovibrionaceae bacterium]
MQQSTINPDQFTGYQKFVIAILAFLQFTIILDFMIMSPMGAILMPALKISPAQFGTVVSAYALSAGISGFLAAGFADRYDRKKLLLFFYAGFVLGTLFCGLAPNYYFLLAARIVTGIFGGVIGSVVMAIATDLFPFQMRGRVMGFLQTAFAASQILGIPAGLFFSNHWGWHSPFLMIVAVSAVVGGIIVMYLKPVNSHLAVKPDRNAFHHLFTTLKNTDYILPFLTTGLLSLGGYMLMPFSSAFTVHNLGIHIESLPSIYLFTGLASIFIGPLVGKAADAFGKFKVFVFGSGVSAVMVVIYTNLGITPLYAVVAVNTVMFVGIFSRMIPSQALMSAIPTPENRGAFMAVSASLQQLAGGVASLVAGLIVVEGTEGVLEHFDTLGYIMVGTTIVTTISMYIISNRVSVPNAHPA